MTRSGLRIRPNSIHNSIHIFEKLKAAENLLDRIRPDWSGLDSDSNFMLYRNHIWVYHGRLERMFCIIQVDKKAVRYQNNMSNKANDEA